MAVLKRLEFYLDHENFYDLVSNYNYTFALTRNTPFISKSLGGGSLILFLVN